MLSTKAFHCIIMAGGKGSRMQGLPKACMDAAGRPIIRRIISAIKKIQTRGECRVVVSPQNRSLIKQALLDAPGVSYYLQQQPKGTAHAAHCAKPHTLSPLPVLITNADHPMVEPRDISRMLRMHASNQNTLSIVACPVERPGSYGRVCIGGGHTTGKVKIIEAKQATPEQLNIKLINTGFMVVQKQALVTALKKLMRRALPQGQREHYITHLPEYIAKTGALTCPEHVSRGVNTLQELAQITRALFLRKNYALMQKGVHIVDPYNTYIEDSVRIGKGCTIYPGVFIQGQSRLGQGCTVEPHCFIMSTTLKQQVQVKAMCYLQDCYIKQNSQVGPFARLRDNCIIGANVQVGNFVELKRTTLKPGTKAKHLSYLGNATIGANTNIGCGTVTCNYGADRKKHPTHIGADCFIGSGAQLVAPIKIGRSVTIGAGSVITKNVPAGKLALGRAQQVTKQVTKQQAKSPTARRSKQKNKQQNKKQKQPTPQ